MSTKHEIINAIHWFDIGAIKDEAHLQDLKDIRYELDCLIESMEEKIKFNKIFS